MNLLKTSVLNGVAVLIKTATMFILNKILAIYVGPAGYAAIGQFQNFIQMVTAFAGGAINTAVIKYTAEYHEDENKQRAIWKAAGSLVLIFSFTFTFIILTFQKQLSIYIFQTAEYQYVFLWFALFLVFFNLNTLFLAILNGKKEILKLVIANIIGSIFSLLVTGTLAIQYHLYGALIALSIYQSLAFFVTLFLCYKANWFKFSYLFGKIEPQIAKNFLAFALMALVSIIFGNLSQIILRKLIINKYGIDYAGYWDAMGRLSNGYLMFATTLLSVYYLPRLSELINYNDIKKEIFEGYKIILPLAFLFSFLIYIYQDLIIKILFSKEFMPIKELIFWHLLGDIVKIGGWIIGFLMLSKAMTKLYIFTELFFALSILPLSLVLLDYYGFKGAAIAFFVNCLLYWVVCSFLSFRKLKRAKV